MPFPALIERIRIDADMTMVLKQDEPQGSWVNDPAVRGVIYQVLLAVLLAFFFYAAATNALDNLTRQKIASGFGFWNNTAGFDIGQHLIKYETISTYGAAFWVGLTNTLLVAVIGIVFSTIIGFVVGVARLSPNWLVNKLATVYVETIRNIPLLLQLLFWYNAVLKALPEVRDSIRLPGPMFLNTRGLRVPEPLFQDGFSLVVGALIAGVIVSVGYRVWAKRRLDATGQPSPVGWVALALVIGAPLVVFALLGAPLGFNAPELGRFNIQGGVQIFPEFVALTIGLSIYTAAFIAEAVRAGIQSVSKGQTEAAAALGLRTSPILSLVVVPQAMRVVIPPLTSQYLNLIKNSSLAVAVGYPDLVQVFMGTVLNQTGQAVECVSVTMGVYLVISLVTSFAMNEYNKRIALVER